MRCFDSSYLLKVAHIFHKSENIVFDRKHTQIPGKSLSSSFALRSVLFSILVSIVEWSSNHYYLLLVYKFPEYLFDCFIVVKLPHKIKPTDKSVNVTMIIASTSITMDDHYSYSQQPERSIKISHISTIYILACHT